MANLFLSHSSHDQEAAESLHEWLKARGYEGIFLDSHPEDGIPAGTFWERELYRNLRASDAVIVLCSEAAMQSRWCFAEITHARAQGLMIFPVKLEDCVVDRLLDDRQVLHIGREGTKGYERLLDRLQEKGLTPENSFKWNRGRSPYPGLNVFEREDAGVFFGREHELRRMVATLNQLRTRGSPRMMMIAGASGSGKSSLMRAGIVPRITRDREVWRVVGPFRPNPSPIGGLAQALAKALTDAKLPGCYPDDWRELRDHLHAGDDGAVKVLISLAERLLPVERPGEAAVLLVIDQWEESLGLGSAAGPPNEHAAFHRLMRGALEYQGSPLMALATIRSDFFDASQNHVAWHDFERKYEDLGPMPREQFARVVEGPAIRAGLSFEYGLVARLVDDAGDAGALPLLAFTLRELSEHCTEDGKITFRSYEHDVGGMHRAVTRAVEKAVGADFSADKESALRHAFLSHLVWIDDRGRFLRRRANWDVLPDPARPLLEEFIKARLLISHVHDGQQTVEVVHEILFEAWERLKDWLRAGEALLRWRRGVEPTRLAWERASHDLKPGFLLTGNRVVEARSWLAGHSEYLQPSERQFLQDSIAAEDERFTQEKGQRVLRRRLAVGVGTLAMAVAAVAAVAFQLDRARQIAEKGHLDTKLARTRLLQDASLDRERMGDSGTSAVLLGRALVEAAGLDTQLEEALRTAITLARGRLLPLRNILQISGEARGCAISHDGKWAVVGSANGRVWCVDLARSQLTPIPGASSDGSYRTGDDNKRNGIFDITFEPKGTRFACATVGGTVHVVDVLTAQRSQLIVHRSQALSVSFSPDGSSLVVAGRVIDGKQHPDPLRLAVYGIDTGTVTRFPIDYDLYVASFSPDGKHIAVGGGDGSVNPPHPRLTIWDAHDPSKGPVELPQPARVFALAFNPTDGTRLVTGDVNGVVRFWDLSKKAAYGEIPHDKQVRVTSFSEDGHWLLVGGEDGTARVWDVDSRHPVSQRLAHRGQVRGGAISLRAGWVVTSDFADGIHLWDAKPSAPAGQVLRHPSPVWDAMFDEAGDRILTGYASSIERPGAARIWNLTSGETKRLEHGADVMVAQFRPRLDGEAVTCGNDGSVYFWDTRTQQKLGYGPSRQHKILYSAAFDPTGTRFAFAGNGGAVRILDFDSRANSFQEQKAVDKPFYSFVWNLRFGMDKNQLFGDGGRCVRVWNLGLNAASPFFDLPPPRVRIGDEKEPECWLGAFDGNGRHVLTLGADGQVSIWDLKDRDNAPNADPVFAESPHGLGHLCADWHGKSNVIATGGADGVACIWTKEGTEKWSCKYQLRHPSPIEILTFSPDGRWLATGCLDGGMRLWSVGSGVWTGAGWYHDGPVTRVRFSADGRYLLSASRDGTARVVPLPKRAVGTPKAILAGLEADAGILVAVKGSGTTSSVTAPRPLSASELDERRVAVMRAADSLESSPAR